MVRKITSMDIIRLYLNDYDRRYYLREMALTVKKPHQTIKKYVEKLVEDGIFTKNERKNIVEYGLNFRKREVYDYLVIAEKQKMMGCLNKDMIIKTLFDKVSAFFDADTFIIFGSSALDAKKASDIDLLIIGRKDVSKALKEFEEIYNKRVHAIKIRDLKHIKPELMIELYKKHIILNDTERIIRLFGGLHEKNKLV